MCPQIIAESQVAGNIPRVALGKYVDLVGAGVAAFAQIAPSGDAELPEIFIADGRKRGGCRVGLGQGAHDRQDVDDRLCGEARDGRAADVVDADQVFAQDGPDFLRFRPICLLPGRLVVADDDVLWHGKRPPLVVRCLSGPLIIRESAAGRNVQKNL